MSRLKDRKAKLKAETALANERRAKLEAAEATPDQLADLPMFVRFSKSGLSGTNTYYPHCPDDLREWVFDLTKRNMMELYEKTWGWDDRKKERELYDDRSRYLVLRVDDRCVGFAHFRFEWEQNALRLYIFEFQIEREFQRKGLGKFLLQTLEFIALRRGMECVMLTVLHINTNAVAFYSRNPYVPHILSPSKSDPANPDYHYEILFKSLVKKS
jgi:ribosomal protein S18 acetylase RimI-like enzyme